MLRKKCLVLLAHVQGVQELRKEGYLPKLVEQFSILLHILEEKLQQKKKKQGSHHYGTKSKDRMLSITKFKIEEWDIDKYVLLERNSIQSYDDGQQSVKKMKVS